MVVCAIDLAAALFSSSSGRYIYIHKPNSEEIKIGYRFLYTICMHMYVY